MSLLSHGKGGGNMDRAAEMDKLAEYIASYRDSLIESAVDIHVPPGYELPLSQRKYSINADLCIILYSSTHDGRALFHKSDSSNGFRFRYDKPKNNFSHTHDYIEFLFVVEGCFRQVVKGVETVYRAGDFCFSDMESIHYDVMDLTSCSVLFFCLSSQFAREIIDRMDMTSQLRSYLVSIIQQEKSAGFMPFRPMCRGASDITVVQILQILKEVYGGQKTGQNLILQGMTLRLFEQLEKNYSPDRVPDLDKKYMKIYMEIERYIRENYTTVTARELEEKFHFNINYFNLLFQRFSGFTYKQYLQKIRVDRACELLADTDMPVKDISEAVGYENRTYFYKLFTKITRLTPVEYRNRHRLA